MKSLLENDYEFVLPIYPWLNREFAGKSQRLHRNFKFRVLVLFPRRPKISNDHRMFVTINEELRSFKSVGDQHGVPVLAGCPIASDFWALAACTEQVWVDIGHKATIEYLLPIDRVDSGPDGCRLSDGDVLAMARRSNLQTMDTFEIFVREGRYSQPVNFFGGRYKPVYFLMV
jgi:hypothetical protein